MPKPDSEKRSTGEILAEIVKKVGAEPAGEIETFVRELADNLLRLSLLAPRAGFQRDNVQTVQYILGWIDASIGFSWGDYRCVDSARTAEPTPIHILPDGLPLELDNLTEREKEVIALVQQMPHFVYLMLWGPENIAALDQEGIEALDQKSFDEAFVEVQKGELALLSMLWKLHERCHRILDLRLGEHGSAGHQQVRAAAVSRELMERCGLPLAYASPTSAYRVVASLLYEEMMGEYGKDLERACETVARRPAIRTERYGGR